MYLPTKKELICALVALLITIALCIAIGSIVFSGGCAPSNLYEKDTKPTLYLRGTGNIGHTARRIFLTISNPLWEAKRFAVTCHDKSNRLLNASSIEVFVPARSDKKIMITLLSPHTGSFTCVTQELATFR